MAPSVEEDLPLGQLRQVVDVVAPTTAEYEFTGHRIQLLVSVWPLCSL